MVYHDAGGGGRGCNLTGIFPHDTNLKTKKKVADEVWTFYLIDTVETNTAEQKGASVQTNTNMKHEAVSPHAASRAAI